MKVFSYLYYRMYKAYSDKNDSPLFRTFMYMTLVQFFIVGAILIYLEKILVTYNALSQSYVNEIKQSYFFWGIIILSILLFTFFYFSRKSFSYYEGKFSKYYSLNKLIKIWMIIALPFFLFFSSISVYILLFGGQVLGNNITGVLTK